MRYEIHLNQIFLGQPQFLSNAEHFFKKRLDIKNND